MDIETIIESYLNGNKVQFTEQVQEYNPFRFASHLTSMDISDKLKLSMLKSFIYMTTEQGM